MLKKLINSPWGISLGSTAFGVALTVFIDFLRNKPILSTLNKILIWLSDLFITIMRSKLELWWVLIGVLVLILILSIIDKSFGNQLVKQKYNNYTNDKFKQWEWEWKWKFDTYNNCWSVSDLKAKCPKCGSTLLEFRDLVYDYSYECPLCNFRSQGERNEHPAKIEALIVDKVNQMIKQENAVKNIR